MNKGFSNGRATGRFSAALTAAVLGCLSVAPAQAQYNFNGNLGYMAQNTLLYPLSRMFNVPYNYNVLNPYYLLQMGAGTTAQNYYGNFRAPGYGAMPGVPAPFGFGRNGANKNLQAGFTPDDPDTQQPGTLTSGPSQSMAQTGLLMPQLNGRGAQAASSMPQSVPQSVQASSFGTAGGMQQGMQPGMQTQGMQSAMQQQAMQPTQGFQSAQSQAQPGYSPSNMLPPRQTVSSDMPPVAPSRHGSSSSTKHSKHSRADQQASTAGQQSAQQVATAPNMVPSRESTAPLAAGFVELVNAKYDGDIGKALFNTDTRAWAHAVGLVDNEQMFGADLSQSRISLMSGIMKDPNLDAVSKLDAVKILLRGATTATPVAGH